MTEEIKEILEALKPHNDIKEYPLYLNKKQQHLLYDYITNLQQENDALNLELFGYREAILKDDELLGLKQENETLKAKLEIGKTCGFCPYYKYKQRCQKAIEYIEKHQYKWYDLNGEEYIEPREFEKNTDASVLLDILQGSDDK